MEHFWRATSLKSEISQRLEGAGPSENSYKYNSLLVLDTNTYNVVYVFPRHSAGEWIVKLKGAFLTVASLSDDILKQDIIEPADLEADNNNKDNCSKSAKNKRLRTKTLANSPPLKTYHVVLQIDGGPVYCTIARFRDHILVQTSDTCRDTVTCLIYLYNTLPAFVPESHNSLISQKAISSKVVESFVAPALEVTGTSSSVSLPTPHHGQVFSSELQASILDLEIAIQEPGCVTCGGIIILSHSSHLLYSSIPPDFQTHLIHTLHFRELTSLSQGHITWFNKLYRHPFSRRPATRQWYILTVATNIATLSQVLAVFGDAPSRESITSWSRDLSALLESHTSEIRQHLPSPGIGLEARRRRVMGYKYGEEKAFYSETRFKDIIEYHHYHDDNLSRNIVHDVPTIVGTKTTGEEMKTATDSKAGSSGSAVPHESNTTQSSLEHISPPSHQFVGHIEDDLYVGQQVIGGRLFSVVYETAGIHDVHMVFRELGL